MAKLFSRKLLALELVRHGVLPGYAWRVTGELADHADDISLSGCDAADKLGDVNHLVSQIVDGYRRRTFAGRHPLLTFVLAPFPLAVVSYMAYWFVGVLFIFACSKLTTLASIGVLLVHIGSMCVPLTLVVALISRLARRAGLSWKKTMIACGPVLLLAGLLFSRVTLDSLAHGQLMFGISVPGVHHILGLPTTSVPLASHIGQLGFPLCAMFWMFLRERAVARKLLVAPDCQDKAAGRDGDAREIAEAA